MFFRAGTHSDNSNELPSTDVPCSSSADRYGATEFYHQDENHLFTVNPLDLHDFGKSHLSSDSEKDLDDNTETFETSNIGKKLLKKPQL